MARRFLYRRCHVRPKAIIQPRTLFECVVNRKGMVYFQLETHDSTVEVAVGEQDLAFLKAPKCESGVDRDRRRSGSALCGEKCINLTLLWKLSEFRQVVRDSNNRLEEWILFEGLAKKFADTSV